MSRPRLSRVLVPLLGVLLILPTAGRGHHHREHADAAALQAHAHGEALLRLALDGGLVELELEIAGMDAVGFERPPRDETEREAIAGTLAALEGGAWLRPPPGAACGLERASFRAIGFGGEPAEGGTSAGEGHAAIRGSLRLACLAPERLDGLEIDLSALVGADTRLEVEAALPSGQRLLVLPGGKGRIPLEPR